MMSDRNLELWFVTGSQHLYGSKTLEQVASDARQIAASLDADERIPMSVIWKPTVTRPDEILALCRAANTDQSCAGLIVWMHTFSPAKMWISGLLELKRPFVHLHTQHGRDIPWGEIDMDFMNLHQSAHGGREFGHLCARMRINRSVVVGHWQDEAVRTEVGHWARVAMAWKESHELKVARFGDNMREVAVTEGDKVEAQLRFGFSVNGYGMGDLKAVVDQVSDVEIDELMAAYKEAYVFAESVSLDAVREQARIEVGMRHFLEAGGFGAFTTTFEDLHGFKQLPGLAVQRLMASGYGFGAEGDWKTAAMTRLIKVMGAGCSGGTSFMEDYTYHLDPANPQVLGAHMLEVCPSIAQGAVSLETHPLGIGGKADPARLVFTAAAGPAINVSLVDLGNRFRMLVNEVDTVAPAHELPNLPVARALWQPRPNLKEAATAWILSGGAHHTVYSQQVDTQQIETFCEMAGIELVVIDAQTTIRRLKQEFCWNEAAF